MKRRGWLIRKVLIWSVRVLGALLIVAFLFAGAGAGRIYWLASSGLPDHRLVDGANWHGCIPPGARRAEFVPLSAMPANAINAFLAAEEPDFLTREAFIPFTRRNYPISLAYAQQLYICGNNPAGESMRRKVKQILLHYRIERDLPRRSILETVMNTVYLGKGAYGMRAAAPRYFQKPLTELSTGELAFLAGMHKAWREGRAQRSDAILLRNTVLDRMAGMGALTAEQAAAAKLEPLNLRLQN